MLTRLYVDNYRCLVNFEFHPVQKQLVIGQNGTGKSTALEVLSLLRDFSIRGVDVNDPKERLAGKTKTRWQTGVGKQRFELDVAAADAEFRYVLEIDEWGTPSRPRVVLESVECDGHLVFHFAEGEVHLYNDNYDRKVSYHLDWYRSALATIDERPENTKLTWFKRWLRNLVHVQINPWAMVARSEKEAIELRRDLGNFADWYRHLKLEQGSEVENARLDIMEAIPGLTTLDAKEAGQGVRVLEAAIGTGPNGKSDPYSFDDLSEGQRALIALYMLTHCAIQPSSTLLIDEPDGFIALPEIQPWLLKTLDRVDEKSAQILIVSHHPELLNQLAGEGGVVFNRTDGRHTRALAFETSDDTGLTPSELIARGWESG